MKSTVLPPNILKCLSAADRKSLGRGGLLPEEALRKPEIKSERQLQNQIVGLLRLRGIEPIVSRFGKKTTNNIGTPDILFAVCETITLESGRVYHWACAWEVKMPGGKESKEQAQMAVRLSTWPNCWRCRVIHSIDEALAELAYRTSPTAENLVSSLTS